MEREDKGGEVIPIRGGKRAERGLAQAALAAIGSENDRDHGGSALAELDTRAMERRGLRERGVYGED